MATSGNYSWTMDANDIIANAYAKFGIPGENNTLTSAQLADGYNALNQAISIALVDGMPLWKRISLTQPLSSTVNQVYTVNNAIKVADVFLYDYSGVQYSLKNKSLYDFNRLPGNAIGVPVHWTWQPNISEGSQLSLWPYLSDSATVLNKYLVIIYQQEFQGMINSTDTLDFPSYWLLPLIYKTAVILAPAYGVPINDRRLLMEEANIYWKQAEGYGDEDGSFYVQPDQGEK